MKINFIDHFSFSSVLVAASILFSSKEKPACTRAAPHFLNSKKEIPSCSRNFYEQEKIG